MVASGKVDVRGLGQLTFKVGSQGMFTLGRGEGCDLVNAYGVGVDAVLHVLINIRRLFFAVLSRFSSQSSILAGSHDLLSGFFSLVNMECLAQLNLTGRCETPVLTTIQLYW